VIYVVIVVSVMGALLCWRVLFRFVIADMSYGRIEGEDVAVAALVATAAFWIVPFALPFIAVRWASGGDWARVAALLGGESRARKLERREASLRERENRIDRLEREAGIA
jgi:hypothetical protein